MSIEKYAYLLDQDNFIIGNKVFYDLIAYICKEKKLNVKSYTVRTAGIMLQQIYYWSMPNSRGEKKTWYSYNDRGNLRDVVKKDYEDWWNDARITEKEIASSNKLLEQTGLIKIYKMKIKVRSTNDGTDNVVYKPSNCYWLNKDEMVIYMDKIVEIMNELYKVKIEDRREKRKINSQNYAERKELNKLSTDDLVIPVTAETAILEGLDPVNNNLSTKSTESTEDNCNANATIPVTAITKEIPVTAITKEIPVTAITKEIPVTAETNNTNTTPNSSFTDGTLAEKKIPLSQLTEKDFIKLNTIVLEDIKSIPDMKEVSFNTWFKETCGYAFVKDNCIMIPCFNDFTIGIIKDRFYDVILNAYHKVFGNVEINIIKNLGE